LYNSKVINHLAHPRNEGEIPDPDGLGRARSPLCKDEIVFTIKVRNDIIQDVRFKTFTCGTAIATGSVATELIMGKHIDDALRITGRHLIDALGGLPEHKLKCTTLTQDAFRAAIEDFKKKNQD